VRHHGCGRAFVGSVVLLEVAGAATCEGHVHMPTMGQVQVHCLCLAFLVNSSPARPPSVCTNLHRQAIHVHERCSCSWTVSVATHHAVCFARARLIPLSGISASGGTSAG
jgi:hypothetical protein